jgi:hypothetical protein
LRRTLRVGQALLVPSAALAVALLLAPGRAALAIHVYALVVLALGLAAAVGAISASQRGARWSAFDAALDRRVQQPERLPELARLEREAVLAHSSAFDVHFRLRPVVREIAAGLLAARRRVDLDGSPEQARALLGEETWQLVRADRPPPHDRLGPGIDTEALARLVASLERL